MYFFQEIIKMPDFNALRDEDFYGVNDFVFYFCTSRELVDIKEDCQLQGEYTPHNIPLGGKSGHSGQREGGKVEHRNCTNARRQPETTIMFLCYSRGGVNIMKT